MEFVEFFVIMFLLLFGGVMQGNCYSKLVNAYKIKKKGCIIFNGHRLSVTQLLKDIESFSVALKDLGFKKGETLTLYLPTCPQAIVGFYACSKLGIIANIVHPLLPLEQLAKNLKQTNSKGIMFYDILIDDHRQLEQYNQIMINCSVADYTFFRKGVFLAYAKFKCIQSHKSYKFGSLIGKYKLDAKPSTIESNAKGEDIVTSMHSGGTSGSPKIVMISNNALNDLCDNLYEMYIKFNKLPDNEYSLVALPIFHAYGLGVSIHTCLVNHYNLILVPKFNAKKLNSYIKNYNVTFMAGVPIMFKKMMEEKNFAGRHLKKLKDLWCGGDTVSENLIEYFDEILKKYKSPARLMRGYGLTEVCSVCAVNTLANYKKFSCGKAIPNTKIVIRGSNKNILPPEQIGEIYVASPSMMNCYSDGTGIEIIDGEKWINTGDVGYLDNEGFLFIVDRAKRTIKISAINIFPSEIEEVALKHELVKEACAVPYHYNDKTYIKLFVTLKTTDCKTSKIQNQVINLIKHNLIKYATPREVVIIDSMPMTQLGKIDYKKLEMM